MFEPDDMPADGATLVIDCRSYATSFQEAQFFTSLYKSVLFLSLLFAGESFFGPFRSCSARYPLMPQCDPTA
jgi:hypothetical protein